MQIIGAKQAWPKIQCANKKTGVLFEIDMPFGHVVSRGYHAFFGEKGHEPTALLLGRVAYSHMQYEGRQNGCWIPFATASEKPEREQYMGMEIFRITEEGIHIL